MEVIKSDKKIIKGYRYKHALATGGIVGVMFLLLTFLCNITPFGDSTWLVYDMKRQYVDFYSYYKSVLDGKNNIFYSFAMTLGSGSIGFFVYYLSSPLLLLLNFIDKSQIPAFITLIIGFKLMLAGFTCDLFLSHYIDDDYIVEHKRYTSIFAIGYAFSAYMISNCINPMWLEVFFMMPVVTLMLDRLIERNRKLGYIFSLAFMVWCNYYIAFMVCIFIIMWTLYRVIMDSEEAVKKLIRVGVCSVWAALLDGILIIPTVIELNDSPKDIFSLGLTLTKGNIVLRDIISKLWFFTYDRAQTMFGTPLVYAGVSIVFLSVMYFFNIHIALKEKICMATMMLIFIVSFCFDRINLIWHAGMEPSGYPYREAFLFVFLCIICSCKCFNSFSRGIDFRHIIGALLIVIGLFVFSFTGKYPYLYKKVIIANAIIILVMCTIFIIFEVCCTEETKIKKILCRMVIIAFFAVQSSELLVNDMLIYKQQTVINMTAQSEYNKIVSDTEEALQKISEDNSFYRMENMKPREQNDAMMYNYNGITHYSSAGDIDSRYFLQKMGFNDDRLYTNYGVDNTATADSLLGIKYIINYGDKHNDYIDISERAKRNPYVLSIASKAIYDEDIGNENPFELQEKMYSNIIGEDVEIFDNVIVGQRNVSTDGIAIYEYQIEAANDGYIYFYQDNIEKLIQNMSIYIDDKFKTVYGNLSCMKVTNLGYYYKGETAVVEVRCSDKNPDFGNIIIVSENVDRLREYSEIARQRDVNVTRLSSSKLELSIGEIDRTTKGIITSIPYDNGWQATCNGKKIEMQKKYGSMLWIPIEEVSDNKILLTYKTKGLKAGVLVSAIAYLAVVIFVTVNRKKRENV